MRPSNLKDVAYSVVTGMSRSINRSAQPIEEESREGSRKGMDVDGYFNVVAGNHGLDIAKAIKVRDEMNEEGILPDTEEFV